MTIKYCNIKNDFEIVTKLYSQMIKFIARHWVLFPDYAVHIVQLIPLHLKLYKKKIVILLGTMHLS